MNPFTFVIWKVKWLQEDKTEKKTSGKYSRRTELFSLLLYKG